ncbi:aromatic acid exporter family protein [Fodinisporobacter ferrooxydans]|uniref:Aromatic acid exporter family protein n=1 Tax=Fodinisporobacter ferrooxydans TaxID=2901836 RepID=A0ABY4CJL3_9BACL|nr:aromatic acid exporter family protein [Alicyclobacillaceae bacterium MYW30-H2]
MNDISFLKRLHYFLDRTSEVWKLALSSSAAWELAKLTGTKHPYFAPIAAILCLQVTIEKSVTSAFNRVIGTIAGVLLTATIAGYLGVHAWSIGLIVFIGTAITKKAKLPDQAIFQVGISAMMVLIFQTQSHTYAFDRIMETVIGALTAITINTLFFPPDFTEEAIQSFTSFTDHIVESFKKLSAWLETGCPQGEQRVMHKEIQSMLEDLHKTLEHFEQARESLQYNLFAKRNREVLKRISSNFSKLRQAYTHLTSMLQALTKWSESGQLAKEDQTVWANNLSLLSSYMEEWKSKSIASARNAAKPSLLPVFKTSSIPVQLPEKFHNDQYPITLYNLTIQLTHDLKDAL